MQQSDIHHLGVSFPSPHCYCYDYTACTKVPFTIDVFGIVGLKLYIEGRHSQHQVPPSPVSGYVVHNVIVINNKPIINNVFIYLFNYCIILLLMDNIISL